MRALSRLADVAGFWTLDRTTITGRSAVILRQHTDAYEGFVTQATRISTLYADLVKETYKPFEGYVAKITPAK